MPNIELVGYNKDKAKDLKIRISNKLRAIGTTDMDSPLINSIVTIHDAEVKDIAGGEKPYIRIASSNEQDFKIITDILRGLKINLDVEILKLNSFIEIRH